MPKAKKASKKVTKKKVPKKAAPKKTTPKKTKKAPQKSQPPAPPMMGLTQPCLSLTEAAFIVGGCLPAGTHNNDETLQQASLIGQQRDVFRQCVFNGVLAAGCQIQMGQIPNSADTTIGAVIQAVFQNSR